VIYRSAGESLIYESCNFTGKHLLRCPFGADSTENKCDCFLQVCHQMKHDPCRQNMKNAGFSYNTFSNCK
jgi:hypothetical protein